MPKGGLFSSAIVNHKFQYLSDTSKIKLFSVPCWGSFNCIIQKDRPANDDNWFSSQQGRQFPLDTLRMPPVADLGCRAGESDNSQAPKAQRRVRRKRGFPPTGRGLGRSCTPSSEIFLTSEWKIARVGAFWVLFCKLTTYKLPPMNLYNCPHENSYTL